MRIGGLVNELVAWHIQTVVWYAVFLCDRDIYGLGSNMGLSVLSQLSLMLGILYGATQLPNAAAYCSVIANAVTVTRPGCLNVTINATICSGKCSSTSKPLLNSPHYEVTMNCCSPAREQPRSISMYCKNPDGLLQLQTTIYIPSECTCKQCSTLTLDKPIAG